ncbi:MAG: hypothetical protein AAGU01_04500 [Clostridiaceae bacterium]
MAKKKNNKNKENVTSIKNNDKNNEKSNNNKSYYRETFDIEKIAKQILDAVPIKTAFEPPDEEITESEEIKEDQVIDGLNQIRAGLQNVNLIREELAKLELNIEERVYYEQEVFPLLNVLSILSFAVERYSLGSQALSSIPLTKSSDICDIIQLAYKSADLSEEVLKILEVKVKKLIKISKSCE